MNAFEHEIKKRKLKVMKRSNTTFSGFTDWSVRLLLIEEIRPKIVPKLKVAHSRLWAPVQTL